MSKFIYKCSQSTEDSLCMIMIKDMRENKVNWKNGIELQNTIGDFL
jgi:hypothetical protein